MSLASRCEADKIQECLQKAKCLLLLLLLLSHRQATLLPTLLLNCNNKKYEKSPFPNGFVFFKTVCVLGERKVSVKL